MRFLACLTLVLVTTWHGRLANGAESTPPNVILSISADHGFTDYGFMGSKIVKTPNLDRMAAESLLYTRGYVMPVRSPSLGCLLTGQLPHGHGITGNDLSPSAFAATKEKVKRDRSPLSHQLLGNPVILPEALGEAGYLTFQTGKLWNVTAEEVDFTAGMTNKERASRWRGTRHRTGVHEADPFEKKNLAKERPEEIERLKAIQNAAWEASGQ